jgi:hypothetical protein
MRAGAPALTLFILVWSVSATGAEATRYLAPSKSAVVNGAGLRETPSDVETPPAWRRGVMENEETDRDYLPPASALRVPRKG